MLIFSIIACFALVTGAFAQDAFNKGDMIVNAGIGFMNTINTGNNWKTNIPPITGSFEYALIDNLFDDKSGIGIGGIVGFASQKYETSNVSVKYQDVVIAARGLFHYQFVRNLDTYAGLMLGYDIASGDGDLTSSGVAFGYYIGARYYFTNNFAVMAEIGDNVALLTLGVAFKF